MHLLSQVLAAGIVASKDGFHGPSIDEFFPEPFLFVGTPFAINRIQLVRLVIMLVMLTICMLYTYRAKVVPGRAQATLEYLLDFCRVNISEAVMGKTYAKKYNGIISAVFFIVLSLNLGGLIPGLNIAGTAVAGIPMILAVFGWFVFVSAGLKRFGIKFLKDSVFPPGVPKIAYIMLTPIEFFSTFVVRPFTLFVRLLANMMSGHLLLSLFILGTNYLVLTAGGALKAISLLTFVVAIAVTCFELLVAFLQAYIFAVLVAAYVDLSVHPAH